MVTCCNGGKRMIRGYDAICTSLTRGPGGNVEKYTLNYRDKKYKIAKYLPNGVETPYDEVKDMLENKQLRIKNLYLKPNGGIGYIGTLDIGGVQRKAVQFRDVIDDCSVSYTIKVSEDIDRIKLHRKLKLFGISTIIDLCGVRCAIIKRSEDAIDIEFECSKLYLPYDCTDLFRDCVAKDLIFDDNIHGELVESLQAMFAYSHIIGTLDISKIKFINVDSMKDIFFSATIGRIKGFRNFSSDNLTDLSYAFASATFTDFVPDLSELDTSNLRLLAGTYWNSHTQVSGLDKISTGNLESTRGMFMGYEFDRLDLSGFDTSAVEYMERMFYSSGKEGSEIILGGKFNTANVYDMTGMFAQCKASYIDISLLDFDSLEDFYGMLSQYKGELRNISSDAVDIGIIRSINDEYTWG